MDENNMIMEQPEPQVSPKAERRWISRVGIAISVAAVVTLLGQMVLSFALKLWAPAVLEGDWGIYLLSMIPIWVMAFPLCWLILRTRPVTSLPRGDLGGKELFQLFLMCFPIMYGGNLLGTLLSYLTGFLTGGTAANAVAELVLNTGMLPTVVFAVLVAPWMEELLFRKLLVDRMARYGEKTAILVSGLVFGLYHGNLYQFFYAAALGMLFAFVYCRTGKLRYSALMHMGINLFGSVISTTVLKLCPDLLNLESVGNPFETFRFVQELSGEELVSLLGQSAILMVYGWLLMGLMVTGLVLLIVRRKWFRTRPGPVTLPRGKGFAIVLGNPGAILAVVVLLGILVMNTVLA